jgi:hypothetical protein
LSSESKLLLTPDYQKFNWDLKALVTSSRLSAANKTHNFAPALPEYLAEQAEEAIKSSYTLEFLGIHREVKERELECPSLASHRRGWPENSSHVILLSIFTRWTSKIIMC